MGSSASSKKAIVMWQFLNNSAPGVLVCNLAYAVYDMVAGTWTQPNLLSANSSTGDNILS